MSTGGNTLPDDLHLRHELGEVQIVVGGETRIFQPEETLETLVATREAYISALLEAQKQPSVQTLAVVKESRRLALKGIDSIQRAELFRASEDSAVTTSAFTGVFSGAQQLAGVAEKINPNWGAGFTTKDDPEKMLEALLEDPERAGNIANQLCLIYRQMTHGAENALYNSPPVEGFFADSLRPDQPHKQQSWAEISKNRKLTWTFIGAAAWTLIKTIPRRKK